MEKFWEPQPPYKSAAWTAGVQVEMATVSTEAHWVWHIHRLRSCNLIVSLGSLDVLVPSFAT